MSLGINDEFTAKMVSSRIGDTTVNVRTNQHKAMETLLKNNEFLHNWSSGEGKRALVGLDEAFKMGEERQHHYLSGGITLYLRKNTPTRFIRTPRNSAILTSVKSHPSPTKRGESYFISGSKIFWTLSISRIRTSTR